MSGQISDADSEAVTVPTPSLCAVRVPVASAVRTSLPPALAEPSAGGVTEARVWCVPSPARISGGAGVGAETTTQIAVY